MALARRLSANLADLFAQNELSASRLQEVAADMHRVAPAHLRKLARYTGHKATNKNAARQWARHLLKGNLWPHLYWAEVRCLNVQTQVEEPSWVALRLPHEYVACLCKHGSVPALMGRSGFDPLTLQHLEKCERSAGCSMLGLGMWGDGIPVQWDRKESIDTLNLNIPGLLKPHRLLRLPLVALAHKHVGKHTWDDIGAVLAWSFRACATGRWPSCRHDGTPWRPSDRTGPQHNKGRHVPRDLGCRAALVEIRADWLWFNEVFHFPTHNSKQGCCWFCTTTPAEVAWVETSFLLLFPPAGQGASQASGGHLESKAIHPQLSLSFCVGGGITQAHML